MLVLEVKGDEMWDEANSQFVYGEPLILHLEHSLYAIAMWEAKWQIPFLDNKDLTNDQLLDYIACMADEPVTVEDLKVLKPDHIKQISDYMANKMTATWFSDRDKKGSGGEIVTAELVYYWMATLQIPFTCEKWHFNRLMTLIRVASIKNQPPKKMSKSATFAQNNALNKVRRAKMHSKG